MSGFRSTEDAPGAYDQEQDYHTEGQESGGRRTIEGADEAFGKAEQEAAERRAGDRAHAAENDDDEGHQQRAFAQQGRDGIDLAPERTGEGGEQDRHEKRNFVDAARVHALGFGDFEILGRRA